MSDKTRKPGKAPIAPEPAARLVALTCTEPPHQATHWTGGAMAKTMDILLRSIQRIWQAQELHSRAASEFSNARAIALCR